MREGGDRVEALVRMLLLRMDDVDTLLAEVLAAVGDRARGGLERAAEGIGGTAIVNGVAELRGAGSVVVVRSDVMAGVTTVTVNVRAVGGDGEEGEVGPGVCDGDTVSEEEDGAGLRRAR